MTNRCAECEAEVRLMARFCPDCGAPNPARRAVIGTVVAVAVLLPAIVVAIYAATRWERPLIQAEMPPDQRSSQPAAAGPGFDWLAAAMKQCDEKAAGEPAALHFLVVPLVFDPKDATRWRQASLNTIGNALVLPGADTLAGLRSGALSIAPEEYVFAIRDEKTGAVRKWAPANGVRWVSVADGGGAASLRMQYKPRERGREDSWGNPITHRKGNCYWINAIVDE